MVTIFQRPVCVISVAEFRYFRFHGCTSSRIPAPVANVAGPLIANAGPTRNHGSAYIQPAHPHADVPTCFDRADTVVVTPHAPWASVTSLPATTLATPEASLSETKTEPETIVNTADTVMPVCRGSYCRKSEGRLDGCRLSSPLHHGIHAA